MGQTLYEILGLPIDATLDQIHQAHADIKARTTQEMRTGNATEAMKRLRLADRAVAILGNPGARHRYDESISDRLTADERAKVDMREKRQRALEDAVAAREISEHRDAYQQMLEDRAHSEDEAAERHRLREQREIQSEERPEAKARLARLAGHRTFQIALPLSQTTGAVIPMVTAQSSTSEPAVHGPLIDRIEAEGWQLVHAGYVYQLTGSVSRDKFLSSGQQEAFHGGIIGIYMFRLRDDDPLHEYFDK